MFTLTQLESGSCKANPCLSETKPVFSAFQAPVWKLAPGGWNDQGDTMLVQAGARVTMESLESGEARKSLKLDDASICFLGVDPSTEEAVAQVLFLRAIIPDTEASGTVTAQVPRDTSNYTTHTPHLPTEAQCPVPLP